MESIVPHISRDPANPFEQQIPVLTPEDKDYQHEMMKKNADITEEDIEMALNRTDIDPERKEYWYKMFQEIFHESVVSTNEISINAKEAQRQATQRAHTADTLRFFGLVSKMSREEKIQLYVFGKKFWIIPGIHDIRSHYQSYFSTFPDDTDWVAEANKQLN